METKPKRKRIDFKDEDQIHERMLKMCNQMFELIDFGMYYDDFPDVDSWNYLEGSTSLDEVFDAAQSVMYDKIEEITPVKDMRYMIKIVSQCELINGKVKLRK